MRREARALPGVIEVGVGSTMPLRNSQSPIRNQGGRQVARRGRGDAPRGVSHRRPRLFPRRRDPSAQRKRVLRDRPGQLGQGRDHQSGARREAVPRRGPGRTTRRVDRRRAAIHSIQRRLAHRRRRRRQHAGRRAGCSATAGGVHALCPGAGHWRRTGHTCRQQRVRTGDPSDSHCAGHRTDGAHRERDDRGTDQGSKCLAPAAECRTGLLIWHPGGDHRGGWDRGRPGDSR